MSGYRRPKTPTDVERLLRQEAGFGCASCGHPYIEYHHIIPFAEEKHFRPEDMVALCGNCHPALGLLARDRQYEIKHNPYNLKTGMLRGALVYDKRDLIFRVGGNWYENTETILKYNDTSIISCSLREEQALVSLNLLDSTGRTVLAVSENNIAFRVNDLWDFKYQHNVAVARYGPRDIALRIDFRGAHAIIEGSIWLGRERVRLGPNEAILPGGSRVSDVVFSGLNVGIQYSDQPDRKPEAAGILVKP